eukprot:CAMPEP_0194756540 /NCGR_PEP_ID=MMETSP0323_2-20130528/10212_1 /TAXON_ID=2866 ORGANISM="Crypthecodinium cohnii, Strain Seligo" /NCGR_SAMPLE_ID=MMETSP0323_2 /ASSEMBLY_ACC=CAM_ASM_000346 /LENGTH=193 /DNA_ID=CAMNT_0039676089 /DNA_START=103 /DNA_END=685 /DNA_ORIENTATION=-
MEPGKKEEERAKPKMRSSCWVNSSEMSMDVLSPAREDLSCLLLKVEIAGFSAALSPHLFAERLNAQLLLFLLNISFGLSSKSSSAHMPLRPPKECLSSAIGLFGSSSLSGAISGAVPTIPSSAAGASSTSPARHIDSSGLTSSHMPTTPTSLAFFFAGGPGGFFMVGGGGAFETSTNISNGCVQDDSFVFLLW